MEWIYYHIINYQTIKAASNCRKQIYIQKRKTYSPYDLVQIRFTYVHIVTGCVSRRGVGLHGSVAKFQRIVSKSLSQIFRIRTCCANEIKDQKTEEHQARRG